MKRSVALALLGVTLLLLAGCARETATVPFPAVENPTTLPAEIDAATAQALQGRSDVVFVDVREQSEYDAGHIPGITLIPMGEVAKRLAEIPKDKTVVLTCRSGNRSSQVAEYLRQQGYSDIHNLKGGILAWQAAGYPVE